MVIEELMIGNYVLCGGICKVKKISYTGCVLLEDVKTHIYVEADACSLKPIPLTRDVVRRIDGLNVIYETATSIVAKIKQGEYTITLTEIIGDEELWETQVDNEMFTSVSWFDVKYLHEMQNVLNIATGEAVKINL